MCYEGVETWASYNNNNNNNNNEPWGGRKTLPYHACGTAKSRPSSRRPQDNKEDASWLPKLGCLATYVGYVPCVSTCLC